MIIPFFPIYANNILITYRLLGFEIGVALQIGILTSAFMFTRFILAPSFGDLSDSVGRKPIILVGMSIYAFLMIGFGLAFDFLTLLVIRALQGVASASVWPVGEALVVDTAPKDKIGRNLGYYLTSMQTGMATGPFLAFVLYFLLQDVMGVPETQSYRMTFIMVGVLGFLAVLIIAFTVTDPLTLGLNIGLTVLYKRSLGLMFHKMVRAPKFLVQQLLERGTYRTRSMYALYSVAVINGFGFAMVFPVVSLFLEDYYELAPGGIALVLGVVGLLALVGGPLGGHFSDIFGRKTVVWVSGLFAGVALLGFGLAYGLLFLVGLLLVQRFVFAILQPSFRALQSDLTPGTVRGREFGVLQAAFNLGSVLGPIIGGLLYDMFFMKGFELSFGFTTHYYGAGVPFGFAGLIAILASIVLLLSVNMDRDGVKEAEYPTPTELQC